jgi:microcystin-dependent protein
MSYGSPSDPVAGTVITVAYAKSNLLDPIRWLRLMQGNADPPGSSYVVVSDSTTGTTWKKVPADALAAGVAVANLGYTPVNKAGDTLTGPLVVPALGVAGAATVGTTLAVAGAITGNSVSVVSAAASGAMTAGSLGVAGNETVGGTLSVSGAQTNLSGIQATQFASTVATGLPPLSVASTTQVGNLNATFVGGRQPGASAGNIAFYNTDGQVVSAANADKVDGAHASATPTASTVPIADASGTLAAGWIPAGVGAPLVGEIRGYAGTSMTAPNAAGWYLCDGTAKSRTTFVSLFSVIGTTFGAGDGSTTFNLPDLRGRVPLGVGGSHGLGTTGGAETVDLTHLHGGVGLGISGNSGGPSAVDGIGNGGGTSAPTPGHTHGPGSYDVSGTTDNQVGQSAVSILPPYQAVNFIIYAGG